jgi:hypothetical protein
MRRSSVQLQVETLEERTVPSCSPVYSPPMEGKAGRVALEKRCKLLISHA